MNKERAIEILKKEREGVTNYFNMLGRDGSQCERNEDTGQLVEDIEQALDIAIDILEKDIKEEEKTDD